MPKTLRCSSCSLIINIGSYHGESADWYNCLYCRHCGTNYTLWQSMRQAFGNFEAEQVENKTSKCSLRGPSELQRSKQKTMTVSGEWIT